MGRDLNIGIPPVETLKVNIVDGGNIVTAINNNTSELETNSQEIRKERSVLEIVNDTEVYGIEDE
jgi:hypothetical protein